MELADFGAVTLSVTVSKDGKNYFVGTEEKPFKATEVGIYTITYKATDEMGLTTEKTTTLTVMEVVTEMPVETPSEESGCAAAVNGLPFAVLMLLGVAVALKKRKQA